ncbi:peptide chain release factor N(5)-glutamine methyltransferase [Jeongeupia naejangsanensis]|uniref:Release factor glutamine methyltransferase n=1 Tax=Jeongeupia naejangsanensis TaxID=613195 RepID=A0ABS2BP74_9NEIS|nr:peptide chain release factor N(5)-glutamine methyltransferase [Jeongeupia naejangsanensis]MBM3117432.1 peptide chain release factor N(5)-glutamine methyltransferase [Jeongeupia naejangsanensis]
MTTPRQLLADARLDAIDARVLLQHALQVGRAWLIGHGDDVLPAERIAAFEALVARRRNGEPVAYLVGVREFYGRDFAVSPAVLIPRPETELLVELALERAGQGARVVDLGTGSGCIPVTIKLERPDLDVSAVDISDDALAVARGNAKALGANVVLYLSDWYATLAGQTFGVIVSNPPYIVAGDAHLVQGDLRFEPQGALTDFADGLTHIRSIVEGAGDHLAPGGWLLFEHGFDQGPASRALLAEAGFADVQTWTDLAGLDRVSGGRLA